MQDSHGLAGGSAAPSAAAVRPAGAAAPTRGRSHGVIVGQWAVLIVVAVGIALRTYTPSALWLDEAISARISGLPLREVPDALRHDGAPPLHPLLLWAWERLFGGGAFAVRALSGLFGVAALPLALLAGRRVAGAQGGVVALLLMASSPFAVYYSTEARSYSLVMLLVLAGFVLLVDYLAAPSRLRGVALAVLSGLLVLTHYWSLFLLTVVAAGLLVRAQRRRRREDMSAAAWLAGGGVLFLPWLPSFVFQLGHTGTPWSSPPGPVAPVRTLARWGGASSTVGELWMLLLGLGLGLLLLVLAVLAVLRGGRRRSVHQPSARALAFLIAGTLLLAFVVAVVTGGAWVPRYTSVAFPLYVLLATVGLTGLPTVVRTPAIVVCVLLGLAVSIPNLSNTRKTQAPVIAAALTAHAGPGDVVAYCPDQLGPSVSRLLPAGLQQEVFPTGGRPDRVDWVDYAARNRAADPAEYARRLSTRASENALWLVYHPAYRTLEGTCARVVQELVALRGPYRCILRSDPYYAERADLRVWPAAHPAPAGAAWPGSGQQCPEDEFPVGAVRR